MSKDLILDTLFQRRQRVMGSCFVCNEAGIELVSSDASFLPLIEELLSDLLRDGRFERRRRLGELPGLHYVLGAYLVIGSKFDPIRLVEFIRTMPDRMVTEFVANVPVFFHKLKEGYNFGAAPAPELMALLHEIVQGRNGEPSLKAERALRMLAPDVQ